MKFLQNKITSLRYIICPWILMLSPSPFPSLLAVFSAFSPVDEKYVTDLVTNSRTIRCLLGTQLELIWRTTTTTDLSLISHFLLHSLSRLWQASLGLICPTTANKKSFSLGLGQNRLQYVQNSSIQSTPSLRTYPISTFLWCLLSLHPPL